MNIQITQVTNGWIVAIVTPSGQSATYYPTLEQALAFVSEQDKE